MSRRGGQIPTLFERDENFQVVNRPRAECAWVFEGEGEDKWILAAAANTDVAGWPDGEHACEALGLDLAEGIVFHHPDGRRAKIKRKDFPRNAAAA
jgi:hypothetical protein